MIENGPSKKKKGEREGSSAPERVKDNTAATKEEVRRQRWWPIKGLTVLGKLIMEAGAVWELRTNR